VTHTVDVLVVGGGIAGAACAHFCAARGLDVALVEREAELGAHSSGRSAATLIPGYGGEDADELTAASLAFFEADADGHATGPLLTPRDLLWIEPADAEGELERLMGATPISIEEAVALCPVLRPESIASAEAQMGGMDIDVEGLLQSYVRGARSHGAAIHRSREAIQLTRGSGEWTVEAGGETLVAPVVVNAANAWADELAERAGVAPVGLRPLKRTAFIAPSSGADSALPLVYAGDDTFYFKPDVPGHLLCSRADETPHPPGDPRADEFDVAFAIDRINTHTTLEIRSVRRTWAGLRVFAPDRRPVVGSDLSEPSFVWCAGLGGTGVQTSPGLGQRVAAEVGSLLS